MTKLVRIILIVAILAAGLATPTAFATSPAGTCQDGQQSSGAIYRICMPAQDDWNGDLVLFAHGYVPFNEPVGIPEDQLELPNGISLPDIANRLGFAFATTSYSTNGLAVRQGIKDLYDLVDIFNQQHGRPDHVYLMGASEGGLITTLSVEQYPDRYDGGLAACGPVGDFRRQINYWGDIRTLFDYFFPGVIPGSPVEIPPAAIDNWETETLPAIQQALRSDRHAVDQLLRVTRIPVNRRDSGSVESTLAMLLWYNVFATNDGIAKLGGQPFDNTRRVYFGSDNDWRLNREIQRFAADPAALAEIEARYETSGALAAPLVTLHTTGDPVVPFWHALHYRIKTWWSGAGWQHTNIPAFRYGHCNFNVVEVVAAVALLVLRVTGQDLVGVEKVLPDAGQQAEYRQLLQEFSAQNEFAPCLSPACHLVETSGR